MSIKLSPFWLSGIMITIGAYFGHAQTVAVVTEVLPFATSGTVTSGAATAGTSTPSSKSVPTASPTMATPGTKVITGTDGAASLVFAAGTARLNSDSEIKVPDAADKGHSLEMLKGQLFLNISADQLKQRGNSEFKLKTPAALLAVKGTRFFATARNGMEVIGVHEGHVVVQDAAGQASVDLTDGMLVEITASGLGTARPMTSQELETRKEYDMASLTPVAPTQGRWDPLKTRQAGTQQPTALPDGAVRFTWPLLTRKSLVYHETIFRYRPLEDEARRTVAVQLSLRVIGASSVQVGLQIIDMQSSRKRFQTQANVETAEWQTIILPFPEMNNLNNYYYPFRVVVMPAMLPPSEVMTKSGAAALKTGGVLEVGQVRFLQTAK